MTLTIENPTAEPVVIEGDARPDFLRDPVLGLLSDSLDDLESVRIAMQNRFRALTSTKPDKNGNIQSNFGFTALLPEVEKIETMMHNTEALEHEAILNLQRRVRKSPFFSWIKGNKGIGEKQGARLIAVIGDPYWNDLHQRPRTVSELWAYCGFSVINGAAQRRTKGQKSNWSPEAKSRAFLMAQQVVISGAGGRYETLYRTIKEKSVGALHSTDCVRCGPSGTPALAGTELSDGHRDARAKRYVAKEMLKDLWLTASDLHLERDAEPTI